MHELHTVVRGPGAEELSLLMQLPKETCTYFIELEQKIQASSVLDRATCEMMVKEVCHKFSVPLSRIAPPIRIALLGKTTSPGVYDLCSALGKELVQHRLRLAINYMEEVSHVTRNNA